jgi:hypothetical protein
MRDFAIELKQRPGELARVASILAQHGVTLRGGAALAVGTRIVARFVPSDIDAARRALDFANIRFQEGEVVSMLVESRAGELAMLGTRLADAGVALRALYVTGSTGNILQVAIVPESIAKARCLLEE